MARENCTLYRDKFITDCNENCYGCCNRLYDKYVKPKGNRKVQCQSVSKDMQQVVYCEDCKFYELAEYDEGTKNVCRLLKRQMQKNDFCSYGERKDRE